MRAVIRVYDESGQRDRDARASGRFQENRKNCLDLWGERIDYALAVYSIAKYGVQASEGSVPREPTYGKAAQRKGIPPNIG